MIVKRVSKICTIRSILTLFQEHSLVKIAVTTPEKVLRMKIQIFITFCELADIINFMKFNTEIYGILYVISSGFLVNEL
jgi:hypothetical protein